TSAKSPRERPRPKPGGPSSARSATPSTPACRPTHEPGQRAREGNRGTALHPARLARTPNASSSDKPLPDPPPPYASPHAPAARKVPPGYAERLDRHGNKWDSICTALTITSTGSIPHITDNLTRTVSVALPDSRRPRPEVMAALRH